jgi:large subunit ribosomal protein L17
MRHKSSRLRLNQKPDHARLLQRNLVTSLLLYESIRTTQKRARVIAPVVDRLITTAKTKEPHIAIRSINRVVTDRNASRKLMEVLRERYAQRPSGFTTIKAVGSRKGDGARVVDFALVDAVITMPTPTEKKEKKVTKQPTPLRPPRRTTPGQEEQRQPTQSDKQSSESFPS